MPISIREKIVLARREKKLTQQQLADKIGVDMQTFSRWERGIIKKIPTDALEKIAAATGNPLSYFLPSDQPTLGVSEPLAEYSSLKIHLTERPIPVFDVSCGKFIDWSDGSYPAGYSSEVRSTESKDPHAFYVRAHGDSMIGSADNRRTIFDGDLLLIEPSKNLCDGDLVFCRHDDKGVTVKKFKCSKDKIHLIPLNDKYDIITLTCKDRCHCFKVTEIRRKT